MWNQVALALIIVATSIGSAWIALILLSLRFNRAARNLPARAEQPTLEQAIFLFDDEDLVDATQSARALLDAAPLGGNDWSRLSAFLAPRFENFSGAVARLVELGRIELTSRDTGAAGSPLRLIAEDVGGFARLTLINPDAEGQGVLVDGLCQRAMEDELERLRATIDRSPVLSWREDAQGAVIWANRAYILRSDALDAGDEALSWPLPRLFDITAAQLNSGASRRHGIGASGDKPAWFDVYSFTLDPDVLYFAVPADATVRAERALREFVQTLTKTFADLPIGLAIFDRQRQLQLFNPALIDLTQLSGSFLSGRPTLYALLDRLREARMMPEPKDYRSWRQQMTALEQAAAAGHHSETWSLPGGQTYRVTGRPHPDGAIAFLFEDITSEVSLTRRFRAELELGQEVLDAVEEAVAVFLPSGELVSSNAAYARFWGVDPGATLGRVTVLDSVRLWQENCKPSPIWADVRDFATQIGERAEWSADVERADGRRFACRFVPLSAGATLAGFTEIDRMQLPAPDARARSLVRDRVKDACETPQQAAV
jgi:PAS domain-containing protein